MGKRREIDGWWWLVPVIEFYPGREATADPMEVVVSIPAGRDGAHDDSHVVLNKGRSRTPRFAWLESSPGWLLDLAKFDPALSAALLDASSGAFDVIELDASGGLPAAGETVTCAGFPTRATWPYEKAEVRGGPFVRTSDGHLQADFVPEIGFSGGPVLNSEACMAGIVLGSDRGYDQEVAAFHFARILSAQDVARV